MLLFFLVGVDRVEVEQVCTLFSVLIQYFTLASVFWMGAEALLMGKKLIFDVFGRFSMFKFTLLISFMAWGKCNQGTYVVIVDGFESGVCAMTVHTDRTDLVCLILLLQAFRSYSLPSV